MLRRPIPIHIVRAQEQGKKHLESSHRTHASMEPQVYMQPLAYGQMMHPGGWGPPPYHCGPGMLPPRPYPAGRGGSNALGSRGGRRGRGRGYAFNFSSSAKRHNHAGHKHSKKRRKGTWQQAYATAAQASPAVAADTIQSERRHELEAEQLLEQPCFNTWGTNHPTFAGPEAEVLDAPWSVRQTAQEQQEEEDGAQTSSARPSSGANGSVGPTSAAEASTSLPQQQLEAQLEAQGSMIAELQVANEKLTQALQQAEARTERLEQEMVQLRSQLLATGSVQ